MKDLTKDMMLFLCSKKAKENESSSGNDFVIVAIEKMNKINKVVFKNETDIILDYVELTAFKKRKYLFSINGNSENFIEAEENKTYEIFVNKGTTLDLEEFYDQ